MNNTELTSNSCNPNCPAVDLKSLFCSIESVFNSAGDDLSLEQQRFSKIETRLASSRFHLAVLGQFKRGKSTFLNALLGEDLLPSAVVPLTSIPTFISWSADRSVRVLYFNGKTDTFTPHDRIQANQILSRYVTEQQNPRNHLGVASVEIGYPSTLLQNGVVLIDTPGIGSTFDHNTEATMKFLPQCDVAFFLVSADPPITRVELDFLKSVQSRVIQLFFIMNKVDYLNGAEQADAVAFLKKVLLDQAGLNHDVTVFSVSSRQGLEARLNQNSVLWQQSGMAVVEDYLVNFLMERKNHILNLALARKADDVVSDALLHLQLERKSLSLPLDELQKRLAVFQHKLKEAEQKKIVFQDLLAGDKKRTIEFINEQSGILYKSYYQKLCDEADRLLKNAENLGSIEKEIRQHISQAVPAFFNQELEKTALEMDEHINSTIRFYQNQLIELVEGVRKHAADIFEIDYVQSYSTDILELKHEPFWVTDAWKVNWSPLPENWFEVILPRSLRLKRLRKRLFEDIDAIISNNVGNLRWATVCNITDSFYIFGLKLDEQIQRAIKSTGGAIAAAHKKRIEKSKSIESEQNRITHMLNNLACIKTDLAKLENLIIQNSPIDISAQLPG